MYLSSRQDSQDQPAQASTPRVGVITVTYNSELFMAEYLNALAAQRYQPATVVLIDTSPEYPEQLVPMISQTNLPIMFKWVGQAGFSVGNNIGWRLVRDLPYILFLNPDAFPAPDFLECAVKYMEDQETVGMVAPSLLRYDIEAHCALDVIDTTGVVRNWYGNLIERDCGLPGKVLRKYSSPNEIPCVCAAAVLARREALESVIEPGDQIFDESFFMYKEDTDLSWRIRRAGWRIMHHPSLRGYHCRGWKERKAVSRSTRLLVARNEISACIKNRSPFVLVSLVKYAAILMFDV